MYAVTAYSPLQLVIGSMSTNNQMKREKKTILRFVLVVFAVLLCSAVFIGTVGAAAKEYNPGSFTVEEWNDIREGSTLFPGTYQITGDGEIHKKKELIFNSVFKESDVYVLDFSQFTGSFKMDPREDNAGGLIEVLESMGPCEVHIKNLNAYSGTVISNRNNVGGIIGYLDGVRKLYFEDCHLVNYRIEGLRCVGGFIGNSNNVGELYFCRCSISNSDIIANSEGSEGAGGFVGYGGPYSHLLNFEDCGVYRCAIYASQNNVGGFVGSGKICTYGVNNCVDHCSICTHEKAGGLVGIGTLSNGEKDGVVGVATVSNCIIVARGADAGGLLAYSDGGTESFQYAGAKVESCIICAGYVDKSSFFLGGCGLCAAPEDLISPSLSQPSQVINTYTSGDILSMAEGIQSAGKDVNSRGLMDIKLHTSAKERIGYPDSTNIRYAYINDEEKKDIGNHGEVGGYGRNSAPLLTYAKGDGSPDESFRLGSGVATKVMAIPSVEKRGYSLSDNKWHDHSSSPDRSYDVGESITLDGADVTLSLDWVAKKLTATSNENGSSSNSRDNGTSVWLTTIPTPTPTASATPEPTQAQPRVSPVKPTPTPVSPAPFIGLLAGLGAAGVLFAFGRK